MIPWQGEAGWITWRAVPGSVCERCEHRGRLAAEPRGWALFSRMQASEASRVLAVSGPRNHVGPGPILSCEGKNVPVRKGRGRWRSLRP